MLSKNIKIKRETILLVSGSLLLIIAFILFHYNKILEIKDEIYNKIQNEIYKENTSINNNISVNIDVDYVETNNQEVLENNNNNNTINYLAFLEIDKINLKQGLLPLESRYNNVDYRVEILDVSDFPDKINGNFILAGHSGTSNVAYFKNLYKLNLGDTAKVYYQSKLYKYSIVNIYNQVKDGTIDIYRDQNKTTLTLITCTKDDKNSQTIYILELIGVESY
ncbi:MAG: sortase [Bacilli bacterium]|nr:sortase [Bacilli bacterium]